VLAAQAAKALPTEGIAAQYQHWLRARQSEIQKKEGTARTVEKVGAGPNSGMAGKPSGKPRLIWGRRRCGRGSEAMPPPAFLGSHGS
jgi:hypothetical protein